MARTRKTAAIIPDSPRAEAELAATVTDEHAGLRLDVVAARLFPDYSRARLQAWIESGRLTINGAAAQRVRDPVWSGDELRLTPEQSVQTQLAAQDIEFEIIHQDRAIAIINKPPGLTVHPGAGQSDRTLQNALLHRFPQARAVPRAGIIHRLDKDTSGLLVVALTLTAHTRLTEAMANREVRREYDALVAGVLPAGGTVNAPIGRDPRTRTRMAVMQPGMNDEGKPAVTHYRVVERFAAHTHLSVRLETGRTHQIRVHMAHIRHPIVGDATYGGRIVRGAMAPELRERLKRFPRQALHARELALAHPVSGKVLEFRAPVPADMGDLVEALRGG